MSDIDAVLEELRSITNPGDFTIATRAIAAIERLRTQVRADAETVDVMRLRNTPLREAITAINGDRERQYGDPVAGFTVTAGLWSAAFGWDVEPYQVPLAMDLLKTARIVAGPGFRDSYSDKAGYTGLAYETYMRRDVSQE